MSSSREIPEAKPADAVVADEPAVKDERQITLKTADNQLFKVEISVAMEFAAVKAFYEDNEAEVEASLDDHPPVPLLNVLSAPLAVTIEFCRKQVEFRRTSASRAVKDKYATEFLKGRSNDEIKEMILVANYLNIKDFLEVLNQTIADRIKNKSVEYVRAFFGIQNDFTAEEEARLRQEHAWAFEGVDED
uniref:SKP1-like protein n=1 Tax=Rhizophora mucronata TaxID=61149 RepID=A0A2P2NFK5_RHIMU